MWPTDWEDILVHLGISFGFVLIFGFILGVTSQVLFVVSLCVIAFWMAREMFQGGYNRWNPMVWGAQKWWEGMWGPLGGILLAYFVLNAVS